ncbi:MAG: magnesium transporter [Candidatus Aenigmatarchaeota archaeon]
MQKRFPPKAAGRCMITEVPVVKVGDSVNDVKKFISKKTKKFATIDYIFVVDEENVLKGVLSIKELFEVKKNKPIEEVMKKDVVYVYPFTNQERVVYLALSHGIKMMPVVDKEKHFLGVIPYDTILQIFNQEVREDIFKFGGIFHKVGQEFHTINDPPAKMVKRRIPWLIFGIFGGAIAAMIVSFFEGVLSQYLVLASFIPVLVYVSDAAGTQSETLIVRGFALDPKLSIKRWVKREILVALYLAFICGLLLAIFEIIGWERKLSIAWVVGFSMFLGIMAGTLISTFLPIILKKMKIDPAFAAGPFATLLSDITTLAIYFSVASIFLPV